MSQNVHGFTCPRCGKEVAEPYINCPDCFSILREAERMQLSAFRNLVVGLSFLAVGVGLTLGDSDGFIITSILFDVIGGILLIRSAVRYFNARHKRDFIHLE